MSVRDVPSKVIDAVDGLHAAIDENARALAEQHRERLKCARGCSGCCIDGLTVFEVEAAAIVRAHRELVEHGEPHPEGRCAFLDADGGCRVYEQRPYVCRTQGLPLRWIEGGRELRDICALNLEGAPLESLPAGACWPIGPVESRLAALQSMAEQARPLDGPRERVALRDLFKRRDRRT